MRISKKAFAMALVFSFGANAGSVATNIVSTQLDFKVTESLNSVEFSVSPAADAIAGYMAAGTRVGAAYITTVGTPLTKQYKAIRWTPSKVTLGSSNNIAIISGKSDANHKLSVIFKAYDGSLEPATDGWYFNNTQYASTKIDLLSFGEQTILADTYTMYLDAGIYTE